MSSLDEFRDAFGEDFLNPRDRQPTHVWNELCVCGHLDRYHSPSVGGTYQIPEPRTQSVRGQEVTISTVFHGCVGAVKARNFVEKTATADREAMTVVEKLNPTCPCEELRAVAKVDRPNRFFNQRLPADRSNLGRHPFQTGVRAFSTHLGKRKAAQSDPAWAEAEFSRRFVWDEERRVCAISSCTSTAAVFPVFVNGDDLSELRCPNHR